VRDNWYVPSYVVVHQAALKLGLDVLLGKPPRGRVRLFIPRHQAFSLSQPGRSVRTEPIGTVPQFQEIFDSGKIGTDRFP
jgi:hypothetical protein